MSGERRFWKVTRWARALRFWLFLLLALAAWAGFGGGTAHAQEVDVSRCADSTANGSTMVYCPSVDAAMAALNSFLDGSNLHFEYVEVRTNVAAYCNPVDRTASTHDCGATLGHRSGGYGWRSMSFSRRVAKAPCPAGEVWDDTIGECSVTCANRPNIANKAVRGSYAFCQDGCQYIEDSPVGVCLGGGANMYCSGATWRPTGQQCQADDGAAESWNPDQDTCRTTGNGWSECVKNDGTHCVTGAKGTRMCWQPGETGKRQGIAEIEWADRVEQGDTPAPPSNIENPTQETNTGDLGGVSGNGVGGSFVVGGGSGTGSTGGQNNTGEGGSGSGNGNGNGDGDGDDEGPGSPGAGVGDLYESSGDTIADIVGKHVARIENAPIISAAQNFMSVGGLGGGCPSFNFSFFGRQIVVDFYCRPEFSQVYVWVGYFMLFIFTWAAFRIGVLD